LFFEAKGLPYLKSKLKLN